MQNYVIDFVVGPPSTDAKIKELTVCSVKDKDCTPGTLTPAFKDGVTSYKINAPKDTKELEVTATASGPGAVIEINKKGVASGAKTNVPVPGTITLDVTAQDGKAKATYTIVALVGASNDAVRGYPHRRRRC